MHFFRIVRGIGNSFNLTDDVLRDVSLLLWSLSCNNLILMSR